MPTSSVTGLCASVPGVSASVNISRGAALHGGAGSPCRWARQRDPGNHGNGKFTFDQLGATLITINLYQTHLNNDFGS